MKLKELMLDLIWRTYIALKMGVIDTDMGLAAGINMGRDKKKVKKKSKAKKYKER